jgi:uncharacterized protein (TIRG00374 family)
MALNGGSADDRGAMIARAAELSPRRRHPDRTKIVGVLVAVAVVVIVFAYVLPKIADYGNVWQVVSGLSSWWTLALVGASALFVLSDAPPWMTVLPGLGYFNALRMDLAGSALSQVLPGGAAVNAATQVGMLRSWGFQGRPVALAVSLTTLWNWFFTYGFPVIAIGALSLEGGHERTLGPVALAGLVIVVLMIAAIAAILWSPAKANSLGEWSARVATRLRTRLHKGAAPWGGADLVRFRAEAIGLLRHRWPALTVTTLVNQLAAFFVLIVALRALGVTRAEVDLVEAFAAWSLVRALTTIPITPGGLGVQEVALSGALVGFGASNAQAVAVTLVYRFMTTVPTVLLGLASVATYNLGKPNLKLTHPQAQSR